MNKVYLSILLWLAFTLLAKAQWQSLRGPVGGNIEALENFDGRQYCGTGSGGLFYREGSQPWKALHQFNDAVYSVFKKDKYLWVGTQSATWLLILNDAGTVEMTALVNEDLSTWAFASNGDDLYLATNAGVLKVKYNDLTTLNNTSSGLPPEGTFATSITFFNNKLYATVEGYTMESGEFEGLSGVYLSADGGVTWEADTIINNGMRALLVDENILYAGTYNGLFYKEETASEWTLSQDVGEYNGVIDIEKFGDHIYAATFGGVFVSDESNSSWTQLQSSSLPLFVLFLDDYDGKLSCGAYGVNETADGAQWNAVNDGLLASTVNWLLDTGSELIVASETNGISSWNNGTWKVINNGISDPSLTRGLVRDGNTIFACTGVGVYKSADNGSTWTSIQGNLTDLSATMIQLAVLDGKLYGLDPLFGIYVFDGDQTWLELNEGLTTGRGGYEVYTLYGDGEDLYVGAGYGVFKLDQENSLWVDLAQGALPPGPKYSILKDGDKLIATTTNGIVFTEDGGTNWADLPLDGIPGTYWVAHNFIKGPDGAYYMICTSFDEETLEMYTQVYRSETATIDWTAFDSNFPSQASPNFLIQKGDYLYMGTAGKGVYRHGVFGVIAGTKDPERQYRLNQNHPNPANSYTVIEYSAQRNHRLIVTDSKGNVIKATTGVPRGHHDYTLTLNTSHYPSGIYYYFLETSSGRSETKKIIITR